MSTEARRARAGVALGALEGLIRSAEHLLGEGQRNAPVDEGTLRGSFALALIVNGVRFDGSGAKAAAAAAVTAAAHAGRPITMRAEVSANTVYAARQHEELDWHHPKGGRAKYLEAPFTANARRYAEAIRLAAGRGVN